MLLGICALAGCNKIDNPEKSFYIAGTWLGSHIDDDAQRVVCFEANKGTANYVTSYFNPDYSKEELEVPFSFDEKSGNVVMDFAGTHNAAGISQIVLGSNKQDDIMAGLIHYSEKSHKPDSLFLSRVDEHFVADTIPGLIDYHSEKDMGPHSLEDELPKLGWVNPYNGTLSGTGQDNIAAETILLWASKQIGAAAVSTLATKLFNALWDEILPISNPMATNIKTIVQDLEIIEKQLEEINKKLDELIKQQRLDIVTRNLTARNNTFIKLNSSVNNIVLIIENEKKGSDPEVASRNIQKAILEWGNSVYDGNQLYNAVENYVNTSLTAYGYHPYPEMYDDFAYETIAWECDGYGWREMLRTTDEALVSMTSALTLMYWTAKFKNGDISEETLKGQRDKQSKLLETMGEVYAKRAVVRHPDKMICQIYGFHKVFNKDVEWRNLQYPDWYPSSDSFYLNPECLVFGKKDGPNLSRFMTEGEYNTLMKYYSNEQGSLLSIFKKIGFNINTDSPDATKARMLLPNGAYFTFKLSMDQNNDIYVKKVITNYGKTAETDVFVGEVYAPGHATWSLKWIKVFKKYVSYSDHTWFNLEVQQRLQ